MHDKPDMEMIIIKRGHPHEEHPHGGAWKVAFADFMTAMFAFFLVLWIVNSTNKETRSSVARYFNPIRISDTTPARKGLKEPKEADFDAAAADEKAKPKTGTLNEIEGDSGPGAANGGHPVRDKNMPDKLATTHGVSDPVTTRDPFVVLDEIAGTRRGASSADAAVASADIDYLGDGPQPFRDPFAPPTPVLPSKPKPVASPAGRAATDRVPIPQAKVATEPKSVKDAKSQEAQEQQMMQAAAENASAAANTPSANASSAKSAAKAAAQAQQAALAAKEQTVADAGVLKGKIVEALREAGIEQGPHLEVHAVDEGLLISLTDDLNFGMFGVGSAEPKASVVRAMEKVGKILAAQKGTFIVRGHTDGRPFRTPAYDNWRLSAARAQMAAYMLIRGSLDEKRIESIEGRADRDLRVKSDPLAAQNRRIEILLRRPK